ncbi:MAG TPA: transglycosylase family protein [Solirubrobacterales bacterium]|nr:transglycosylase family protein [Solirubrobacterales bacterium]
MPRARRLRPAASHMTPSSPAAARPRTVLSGLLAAAVVVLALALGGAPGAAASGGIGTGGPSDAREGGGGRTAPKYVRIWDRTSKRNKRWARKTAECESGRDPKAIGGGGLYRGAFQFLKSTWRTSPKSPGGDPIRYTYKTQAVVAVALKKRVGTGPWPVCG